MVGFNILRRFSQKRKKQDEADEKLSVSSDSTTSTTSSIHDNKPTKSATNIKEKVKNAGKRVSRPLKRLGTNVKKTARKLSPSPKQSNENSPVSEESPSPIVPAQEPSPKRHFLSKTLSPIVTDEEKLATPFNPELIIERWVVGCFNTNLINKANDMNSVFCPLAILGAYVTVAMASLPDDRKRLDKLFVINMQMAQKVEPAFQACLKMNARECFSFTRLLVDDSKTTTVNASYLRLAQKHLGEYALVRLHPRYCAQFLKGLSGGLLSGPQNVIGRTTGYCSAAAKAKWQGLIGNTYTAPFALTYCERQQHKFFMLTSPAKRTHRHGFESWYIPLESASKSLGILFLRPDLMGGMLDVKRKLTAEHLCDILTDLEEQKVTAHRFLLPKFAMRTHENMLKHWKKAGRLVLTPRTLPFPPIEAIWHSTLVNVSDEGLSVRKLVQDNKPVTGHIGRERDDILKKNEMFHCRIDSPFMFIIVYGWMPLVAGSYAGAPPPTIDHISTALPDEIRDAPSKENGKSSSHGPQGRRKTRRVNRKRGPSAWSKFKHLFK